MSTNPSTPVRFAWPQGKIAAVSLSFDDTRLSQADIGLPLFDRYGMKATFYASPDSMLQRLEVWKKAVANGHEIGNHTIHHPCSCNFSFIHSRGLRGQTRYALEDYTLEQMAQEIDAASDLIRREIGVAPTTFAYPCAQTYVGSGVRLQSYIPLVAQRFLVGRNWCNETHNSPAYCDMSQVYGVDCDRAGFERLRTLVEAAAAEGGWLVLGGHAIGPQDGNQVTLTGVLEHLCQYARQHPECWFDTVANIGKYVKEHRRGQE